MIDSYEKRRLMEISQIPCAIKLNGDFCKCFEQVDFEKIIHVRTAEYSFQFVENEDNCDSLGTLSFDNMLEINVMHNESKFKYQIDNINKKSEKSIFYVGKYVLFTLNIYRDDLNFTKGYNQRFDLIAKEKDAQRQFEELDSEFSTTGYYAPLQIEIGGKFTFNACSLIQKKLSKSVLKSNTNIDAQYLNNNSNLFKMEKDEFNKLFSSTQKIIQGGDIYQENFEKWKETVNLQNAVVIGYKNLLRIETLINKEIYLRLKDGIQFLENKYNTRKAFFNKCEEIKKMKSNYKNPGKKRNGSGSYKEGFCQTQEFPKINVIEYKCSTVGKKFSRTRKECNECFPNLIVGWEIEDNWKDGTNGSWEINDALLTHNLNALFISQLFRGQDYTLKIYEMEVPK